MVTLASLSLALAATNPQAKIFTYESGPEGFNTKTVFYDTGHEVIAVDAQFTPALAKSAIAFLRERTARPLTYLLITHPNPDKFNGAGVFQEAGAKVIASAQTAAAIPGVHAYKKHFFVNIASMFTEDSYPQPVTIDHTFEGTFALALRAKDSVVITELGAPGVSSNQSVVALGGAKTIIVGDLVHHKAHSWLEGGIVGGAPTPTLPSWTSLLKTLEKGLRTKNPSVIGGRGEVGLLCDVIPAQVAYLEAAQDTVQKYLDEVPSRRQDIRGANAKQNYAELKARFETRFPNYALPELIQYGVYGLALATGSIPQR